MNEREIEGKKKKLEDRTAYISITLFGYTFSAWIDFFRNRKEEKEQ